ncbi:phospholipase [Microbacterium sp.]|uniref:aggregation-promoting factor C-terminal-like domain-containing protein n=1 Tax=Microbacterium sp. TaxID=51671 RepID=UPI002812569E|nr:phospholipase [Microbacterium sp.]
MSAPDTKPSHRRLAGITAIAVVLGAALIAAVLQAPAAIAAWSAPSDAEMRKSAEVAQDAGIALTNAHALNNVVTASGLELEAASTSVEFADLKVEAKALADIEDLTADELAALTARAARETRAVVADTDELQDALTEAREAEAARIAAEKKRIAAEEARKAAEEAARIEAEKKAAAAALAAANSVEGAKATARDLASSRYGWGEGEFSCLSSLWQKESGWNYQAYNASSGATGIPQALPGSKMATAGADWRTNAATQIAWGLDYIQRAYGSPCSAWGHSQAVNWY